jgi:hypothetical protein
VRRAALVTLTLEPAVRERWRRACERPWHEYAERHGMDVVRVDAPIDAEARGPARHRDWQRCLVLESEATRPYERVVCVDAEVLIRPDAPSILDLPVDRIGAVDEAQSPSPADAVHVRRTLQALGRAAGQADALLTAEAWYGAAGLPGGDPRVLHGGVLVLSPAHHRGPLRRAYARAADAPAGGWRSLAALSWELLATGRVQELDPRFASQWLHHKCLRYPFLLSAPGHSQRARCAALALRDSFFLSFSGEPETVEGVADAAPPAPAGTPRTARAPRQAAPRAPVALVVFNRPAVTRQVFEALRAARPRQLFVIADGPRPDHADDAPAVAETRRVLSDVDWPCEVHSLCSDVHLGVRRRVDTGLAWLFAQVETAIVLEDDCLPHPDFFPFCEDLLERHRDDPRVLSIGGTNFQFGLHPPGASYHFSRYATSWGWASWRRAFALYDPAMTEWPRLARTPWLSRVLDGDLRAVRYWQHVLARNHADGAHWDAAWLFSGWVKGGLHAVPAANLVSNIGFGASATHTLTPWSEFAARPHEPLPFPLLHPEVVQRDPEADAFLEETMFSGRLGDLAARLRRRVRAGREAAGLR